MTACAYFLAVPVPVPRFPVPSHRLEPSVERTVEHDAARGRERAAPHRERFLDAPHFLARGSVPRDELAAVPARAFFLRRVRADVRCARDVAHWAHLEV